MVVSYYGDISGAVGIVTTIKTLLTSRRTTRKQSYYLFREFSLKWVVSWWL